MKISYYYFILAVFSFLLFVNTISNGFVFDDESVVENNLSIREISNIPKFFTGDEGFHKVIGRYYRPVVSATYTIDYFFWKLNPTGYHLTNIIIHLVSVLLLFRILIILSEKYKYGLQASFIGALIFAVHPIHTEAVSWISGRTDSLCTLFFFAAFIYYIKYAEQDKEKNNKFLLLSLLFYFIALLSKEMAVTFPVIIFLYDFIYRKRNINFIRGNLKTYLFFLLVTILYVLIRYLTLHNVSERVNYLYFIGKDSITIASTMLKTVPVYFKLLFAPINLLYHYNGVIPDSYSLFDLQVIISVIFILVMLVVSFLLYKNSSEVSFCILFFFISLLPVMNIFPTMNLMAERFLYLTSFGLIVLITYLIIKFISKKNYYFIYIISLLIIAFLSYKTFQRNSEWKDNNTLYSTADGIDGTVLLVNAGNIYANNKQYDEAEKRYKRAIEIRDNSLLAHHNLGLIYLLRGDLDSAEYRFKKGISIDSLAPDGYFQLSNVYEMQGRINDAILQLEKLQNIFPDYRESKAKLEMLKSTGSGKDYDSRADISLESFNNRIMILNQRSFRLYNEKKYEEAISDLEELIRLSPEGKSGYLNNIALCYDAMNKTDIAEEKYLEAIKLDEKNLNALFGLADIQSKRGDKEKSRNYLIKILQIDPGNITAKEKLDSLK